MEVVPTSDLIGEHLSSLAESFAADELAFLAMTSKIERPVLDRLAFALSSSLWPSGWLVAREWRGIGSLRIDLAILRGLVPHVLVEAKSMVSFDCTKQGQGQREYADHLQNDLKRFEKENLPDTQIFSLLLAIHPRDPIPRALQGVFKYWVGVDRAMRRFASEDKIRDACEKNLLRFLRPDILLKSGSISGGTAFEVRMDLLWWLFGPFTSPKKLRILRESEESLY